MLINETAILFLSVPPHFNIVQKILRCCSLRTGGGRLILHKHPYFLPRSGC